MQNLRFVSPCINVVGPAGPTTNTARLSPQYEGKTRGYHCSHWALDDGRENARNMLSCKQTSGYWNEKLLHQVRDLFELNVELRYQNVNGAHSMMSISIPLLSSSLMNKTISEGSQVQIQFHAVFLYVTRFCVGEEAYCYVLTTKSDISKERTCRLRIHKKDGEKKWLNRC
jgi:hypothetical protein